MAGYKFRDGGWVTVSAHRGDGYLPDDTAEAHLVDFDEVDPVPTGSADVVVAWVGDSRDRARRALAVEHQRPRARRKVTDRAAQLLGA